jgi:hypothetical protein
VLGKQHPELYQQVMDALKQEKEKQSSEGLK